MSRLKHFHLYKITEEFYEITNWQDYKISVKPERPNIILVLVYEQYPDSVLCIPISKDDDKRGKYNRIMGKHPKNVHPLDFNQYENYALIQNSFFLRKEFVGEEFTVNEEHVKIIDNKTQKNVEKKFKSLYAIYRHQGPLDIQVDFDTVYNIQNEYIKKKKRLF